MLDKLKGIVFRTIAYGDTSLILHIFTQELGLQSFILKSAKKPRSGHSPQMLQALYPVELVAYPAKSGELYRIKEIKNYPAYQDIPFNILKTSMVLFLDEVLIKAIRQHQKDLALFDFISNALFLLDISGGNLANFHILFLLQLCRYLGFYPSMEWGKLEFRNQNSLDLLNEELFFDLKNGIFLDQPPLHSGYIGSPISLHLWNLWALNFENGETYPLSRSHRTEVLETILLYYEFHVDGFGGIKSLEVLTQVFD